DMIDWPTTKTRILVEDVTTGRAFFGADGFLPAYYEALATLDDYLPEAARIALVDPAAITRTVREELTRGAEDAQAKAAEISFVLGAHFRTEEEATKALDARPVLTMQSVAVLGGEDDGLASYERAPDPMHLAASDNAEITRAVKVARSSKGRMTAITPV